jgi:hypothetical protein
LGVLQWLRRVRPRFKENRPENPGDFSFSFPATIPLNHQELQMESLMNDPHPSTPREEEYLLIPRRVMAYAGYVLASWNLVSLLLLIRVYGRPDIDLWTTDIWMQVRNINAIAFLVCVPMHFASAWGLQHNRPWAWAISLTYAILWFVDLLATNAWDLLMFFNPSTPFNNFLHVFAERMPYYAERLLYPSVYPVLLVVFLTIERRRLNALKLADGLSPVSNPAPATHEEAR